MKCPRGFERPPLSWQSRSASKWIQSGQVPNVVKASPPHKTPGILSKTHGVQKNFSSSVGFFV